VATFEELTDEQRTRLGRIAHNLVSNKDPKVSQAAKRLISEAIPTIQFPELQVADAVDSKLADTKKQLDAMQAELMQANAQRLLDQKHTQARERGLDPAEVEEAITKKGIGNWDTAMEFVELTHRSAPATAASLNVGNSTVLPDSEDKEFWKDPLGTARKLAHQTIDELKARRQAR
jgi:hypothetical protein